MIKIYTFSDKRPDFIEKQNTLFKYFIDDDFEFIVVNAASSQYLKTYIFNECKRLNLKCLNFPKINIYPPQPACRIPIQWCWDNFISKDDENISMIIDSDMFIVNKINIKNYLGNHDIRADYDKRAHVNYIWNGLIIFSPSLQAKEELNFSEGNVDGVITDVGGNLYYYIKKYKPDIKHINNIGYICSQNKNTKFLPFELQNLYDDSYMCEFFEQTFFHYRAGSNWNNKNLSHHKKKTKFLNKLVKLAIEQQLTIPKVENYMFHEVEDWWSIDWPTSTLTEFSRFIDGRWTNA